MESDVHLLSRIRLSHQKLMLDHRRNYRGREHLQLPWLTRWLHLVYQNLVVLVRKWNLYPKLASSFLSDGLNFHVVTVVQKLRLKDTELDRRLELNVDYARVSLSEAHIPIC